MRDVIKSFSTINFPLLIFSFLFYFLFGYLLYAALFAAVGSAVDSEADAAIPVASYSPAYICYCNEPVYYQSS